MQTLTQKAPKTGPMALFLAVVSLFIGLYFATVQHTHNAENPQIENAKQSGKNEPHANQKAKESAAEKYAQLQKEFETLKQKPKKDKNDNDKLEKLKKQLKHWKRKMEFKGENHSQKAKR